MGPALTAVGDEDPEGEPAVCKGDISGILVDSLPAPPPAVPASDQLLTSVSLKFSSSESEYIAFSAGATAELLLLLLSRLRITLGPTLPSRLIVCADDCLRPLLVRAEPILPAMALRAELTLLDSRLIIVGARCCSCVVEPGLVTELWVRELLLVLRETTASGSCNGGGNVSGSLPRKGSGEACIEVPVIPAAGSGDGPGDSNWETEAAGERPAEDREMVESCCVWSDMLV
jgi:hypothetical protein